MVEWKESKIEMTKRLQREGLWDEATEFRCEERRRLRASGVPRDEANEKAWQATGEKYPTDEYRAAVYIQASKSPPENCGSPEVADAWYAFFSTLMIFDIPGESVAKLAYQSTCKNAPSEAARQMLEGDMLAFFDDVEDIFGGEIERRQADPSEINESVADELGRYVARLPALREAFAVVA